MTATYRVHGMTCGGCASSVTRALEALRPGTTVTVDLGAATVTLDGLEDDAAIGRAVEEAGFEFGGRLPS